MKVRQWIKTLRLAVFFFMLSSPAYSDIYWESVMETKGKPQGMSIDVPREILDQLNKTETVKYYFSTNGTRMDTVDAIIIMNFENMSFYHLNPRNKTYKKIDMKKKPEKSKDLIKKMEKSIKITPVDEKRKIGGYDCKKYNAATMMGQIEYWVSKDVKEYEKLKELREKIKKLMKNPSILRHMSMGGSMIEQMDGFPVQSVINDMGMTTTTTLKHIEEKTLDKKLFTAPKEYKIKNGK